MEQFRKMPLDPNFYKHLATSSPQMSRGIVWCTNCGCSKRVNVARCLAEGWPKCCGYTMTVDSPEERLSYEPVSDA